MEVVATQGRWQREAVVIDGESLWAVYDGEQREHFENQYVLMGVDEDQASLATVLLDYHVLGDPDTRNQANLREDLEYQVERVPCRLCHSLHSRGGMKPDELGFVCRECQT